MYTYKHIFAVGGEMLSNCIKLGMNEVEKHILKFEETKTAAGESSYNMPPKHEEWLQKREQWKVAQNFLKGASPLWDD